MPIVAPSLLASDFLHLDEACKMINESEADWFHLDIMDGRFVPNLSFGLPVVEHIRKVAKKPCDVHLMIIEPEKFAEAFKKAGANILSVHIEACSNLHRNIQQIKELGMKAGVAINPHTPIEMLNDVLHEIDLVCMMSVNPGFGGQQFITHTLSKIQKLKTIILQKELNVLVEADGGITLENAAAVVSAGADVLVAGSSVFHADDPVAAIKFLKEL
ncbi:MAG: ribulose-phosphate 3-epimerase [Parafilimonas sp.]